MKKLFIIFAFAIISLTSFAVEVHQYKEVGSITDYSKYNMFITEATAVNFEYQPLGSVVSYIESGYTSCVPNTNIWGQANGQYIQATADAALRVLVENAQKIGAYGIMNVKVTYGSVWDEKMKKFIGTYTATGMAIKW